MKMTEASSAGEYGRRTVAADRDLSSVRLFEDAEAFERGNHSRHADVVQAFGSDDKLRWGAPGSPDARVRRAKKDQARETEGCSHMRGPAVISDENGGFREQCFDAGQVALEDLVSGKRGSVVTLASQKNGGNVREIEIAS